MNMHSLQNLAGTLLIVLTSLSPTVAGNWPQWRGPHGEPINRKGTAEADFTQADFFFFLSTPIVREIDGREQVIAVNSPYDAQRLPSDRMWIRRPATIDSSPSCRLMAEIKNPSSPVP